MEKFDDSLGLLDDDGYGVVETALLDEEEQLKKRPAITAPAAVLLFFFSAHRWYQRHGV